MPRALAFDPSARPSEQRLIERACRQQPGTPPSVPIPAAAAPFVGRATELERLGALRDELDTGSPSVVLIRGPSGIGKTRLAQEFLAQSRQRAGAVLLEGRCYERESLPYNAFDSVIDVLSRHLRRLPDLRAAALMPRDAQLLGELFPVLRRVACLEAMPAPRLPRDPLVLRRRAFDALKELLGRIADAAPLVLCVDDMQWADADSLQLLEALLSPPRAPSMLFVGLYLADHAQALAGNDDPEGRPQGLSEVEVPGIGRRTLLSLIEALPDEMVGTAFADRWGPIGGVLVKLLSPSGPVPLHAHPDRAWARAHLGSPFGKTEAWILLDTPGDGAEPAYAGIGFREDVTREAFIDAVHRRDASRTHGRTGADARVHSRGRSAAARSRATARRRPGCAPASAARSRRSCRR